MNPCIALEQVTVRAGDKTLVEGVTFSVQPGEFLALIGPNGAGKSTLLQAILGLRDIAEGQLLVDGCDARSLAGRQRAEILGWLPQKGHVDEAVPVIDLVESGRFRFDESRASARKAATTALESLGVDHLAERAMNTLSGGEAQRVNLAILQAQESRVLLLDEPANHLDPAQQIRTYSALGAEWQKGRAVVCVTHDINLLQHIAAIAPDKEIRIVGLNAGQVAFDSNLGDKKLATRLSDLFGVQVSALSHDGGLHFAVTGGGQ